MYKRMYKPFRCPNCKIIIDSERVMLEIRAVLRKLEEKKITLEEAMEEIYLILKLNF